VTSDIASIAALDRAPARVLTTVELIALLEDRGLIGAARPGVRATRPYERLDADAGEICPDTLFEPAARGAFRPQLDRVPPGL
jgi:hypothetical protein